MVVGVGGKHGEWKCPLSTFTICNKCVYYMCSLARPCAQNRNVSEAWSSTQGPLGCGAWGGGLGPKSGCRLGCGDPGSAVSPPWGRLGGLRAGATWHLAPTGCQAAGQRLGSMSSLWAQQLHLAGEALSTPRCALRPTSSSLLSWTCSCFCLFHTALP